MHSLLSRQLKRHFGSDREDAMPDALRPFLSTVDAAYEEFDDDRRMLERSLEISSTELMQSNTEMRTLLRAFPDLIVRLDASGEVLDVKGVGSPGGQGQSAGAHRGTSALPPEVSESVAKAARETAASRSLLRIECAARDRDGERFYEVRLLPFLEGQVLAVVREITTQRRTEQQLRESQKLEAIGQLAGGVAHDFNNLLTVILGYAQMLQMEIAPASPAREDVDEIQKAATRAAALTGQLLTFSRRQVVRPRIVHPNAVLAEMEKMLRRLIREDIELSLVLRPEVGTVRADPGLLGQVVMNLVVNARDAMPHGGRILLETACVELDDAYVAANRGALRGHHVLVAVTDTGCGMDEATQRRIFEPFFTTKEPGRGTGLGLSTVYGIVAQCGGHIRVNSEVGRGTTFRILIPTAGNAPATDSTSSGSAALAAGTETVLLVEDETALRKLAGDALRKAGYRVLDAGDGEEALRVAQGHADAIDAVVTDIVMPGLGGVRLVEALRSRRGSIRAIYMSGYSTDAGSLAAETDEDVLSKPFTVDVLLRSVRACLDRRRALTGPPVRT